MCPLQLWLLGEGESGTNGECSINIYILSCAKWIACRSYCITQGAQPSAVMTKKGGVGRKGGRLKRERIYK